MMQMQTMMTYYNDHVITSKQNVSITWCWVYQDEEEAVFATDAEDAAQAGERDEGADADENDADRLETGEVLRVVRDVGVGDVRQPGTPADRHELHRSVLEVVVNVCTCVLINIYIHVHVMSRVCVCTSKMFRYVFIFLVKFQSKPCELRDLVSKLFKVERSIHGAASQHEDEPCHEERQANHLRDTTTSTTPVHCRYTH